MDFRVNADQQALKDGVRSFCEDRVTSAHFTPLEQAGGFDASLWKDLAELGVFALRQSEEKGGLGLGMAEAVLVFEELGRCLAPGPIVWTHLAADLVDGAESGSVVVGGLDLCCATPDPLIVEHWAALDCLLVLRPDGLERADPRHLRVEAGATPLDPLTPIHHLRERNGQARDREIPPIAQYLGCFPRRGVMYRRLGFGRCAHGMDPGCTVACHPCCPAHQGARDLRSRQPVEHLAIAIRSSANASRE